MRRKEREAHQREEAAHRAAEALIEETFPGTVVLREEEVESGETVPKVTFPVGVLRGRPIRDLLTGQVPVREVPGEGGADADSPPGATPHGWFP